MGYLPLISSRLLAKRKIRSYRCWAGLIQLDTCRVTNEGLEMALPEYHSKTEVDLGPQYQVPDPEKGPLGRRISRTFIDGLFSEDINIEEMQYWFTEPPGMPPSTWNVSW